MILSFEVTTIGVIVVTALTCTSDPSLSYFKLCALFTERKMMQGDITGSVITQLIAA